MEIQEAKEPRVPKAESDQIVEALHEAGQEVQYLLAPNEGHGFAREDNRLAVAAALERFLAEQVGGRYQEEISPTIQERLEALTVDVDQVTTSDSPGNRL
jgi:dienelactone hydrolase